MRHNLSSARPDRRARRPLSDVDYRALAAFRSALRRFLRASGERARAAGVTAAQHQLLLAVKGHPGPAPPLVGELAAALQVRPHTVVGLVDRAARAGLASRVPVAGDRRRVGVTLTPRGHRVLARVTEANRLELEGLRKLLGRVSWGSPPRTDRGA